MMIQINALRRLICQIVVHILTSVLQNLGFRRVQVMLCCGAHDILTPRSTQVGPPGLRTNAAERADLCKGSRHDEVALPEVKI